MSFLRASISEAGVLPKRLIYSSIEGRTPASLMLALRKLIELYRTDMANDAPEVIEFMRSHTDAEILANRELWGEDISFLCEELEKC